MSNEQLEKLEELARRAVACKHWRWMPGMLLVTEAANTFRLVELDFDANDRWEWQGQHSPPLPDLTDPATVGCLLDLVREAWGDPSVSIFRSALGQEWCVLIQKGGLQGFHAPTEAEALVAALEGAP